METVINNRYQLKDLLGEGGMGAVYRAYDRLTGKTLALKRVTIPKTHLDVVSRAPDNQPHNEVLANEFSVLASLRHPNIISVLDYGFDSDNQPFFTMDLIPDGLAITQYAGDLRLERQIDLLLDVLQALRYLHQRGIVHRDLKPANILIANDRLKVLDFGLAINSDVSRSAGDAAGTLAYLAPEVLRGKPPSPQSDLYSFGVIAYQVLSGEFPFPNATQSQLIQAVLLEPPIPIDDHLNDLLTLVISRLLEKSPDDRYGAAIDVIRAICDATGTPLPPETLEIRDSFLVASTFVGRDAELSTLTTALDTMLTGKAQSVLIGGESGIGKTRLIEELRTIGLVKGVTVVRGQAVTESNQKYKLWSDVLPHLLLMADISDADAGVLAHIIPEIETLLNRNVPDIDLNDNALKVRLPIAISAVVQRAAEKQPLLLLFEDLQWADASIEVLLAVLTVSSDIRLMVVANYRNDEAAQLHDQLPGMQHIELERLSENHIRELSQAMLGQQGSQNAVVDLIQRESEGNAFFMVEVVRALAEESGELSNIGLTTLPVQVFAGGVQKVIQRRLNQLPEWALSAVQVSAVIGRQIDSALIRHIMPELDIERWLTRCGEVAVFSVSGDAWQFSHDKLREAVLSHLSDEESKHINGQVAGAIEIIYADDLIRYASMLTDYYLAAGNLKQTALYAARGGEYLRQFDPPRAYVLTRRAIELNASQYHEEQLREAARLQHLLGKTAMQLSNFEESAQALEAARAGFEEIGDEVGLARVKNNIAELGFKQGKLEGAVDLLNESMVVLEAHEDWIELGAVYMHMSIVLANLGRLPEAIPYFEKTVTVFTDIGDEIETAKSYNNLAIARELLGDVDESITYHRKALAIRQRLNDRKGLTSSLQNLAFAEQTRGNPEKAKTMSLEALSHARATGNRAYQTRILRSLSQIEHNLDNHDSAISYAHEALTIARNSHDRFMEADCILSLANMYSTTDSSRALRYYLTGLQITLELDNIPLKLDGIANYTRFVGEQQSIPPETKVEWLAATLAFEDSYRGFKSILDQLDTLRDAIDVEHYQAAIETGKVRSLDDTLTLIISTGEIISHE